MTSKASAEIQTVFLNFILSCPELYTRIQNIYNPENFDRTLKAAAKFIQSHSYDYKTIPTLNQINSISSTKLEFIDAIHDGHKDWFLEEFEQFTRIAELERAILKSADLLEKGDFAPVEKLIKDAVQISLTRDMGLDYFDNPRERLMKLKESNGQVSTGWKDVDEKTFGGFNRGELNVFCGGPGAGKSVVLQNLSLNWMAQGLNGIYISLELSQELIAMRLDSMITGINSREIFKRMDDVELKVSIAGKKSGQLRIKFLPSGSTVNDIRSYVKELSIKENYKVDFMCVDYLDLLNPSTAKINPSDIFTKDKLVSEELRNYVIELNSLLGTASQLNRSSFDEIEFNLGNIAGGISKANSSDYLIGIFTSRIMRERQAIQFQFLKTRNSSGLGSKVDLNFDPNSLRITDSLESTSDIPVMSGSNILAQIKNAPKSAPLITQDKQSILSSLLSTINNKQN